MLAALLLAAAQVSQPEIDAAIERGVEHLLEIYRADPSGGAQRLAAAPSILDHPGLHALAVYALVSSGLPPEDEVVRPMLARLAFQRFDTTYDASCMLLALGAHDPIEHAAWIRELARDLLDWQEERGDWGYPEGGDLSNTQFAGLGLWAAARAGVELPRASWARLAEAVLEYQNPDGGFGYVRRSRKASGSMTTAGVGTLALCEMHLARSGALGTELEERLRAARRGGERWLARRFEVDGNPEDSAWQHYYLYGLERMGSFGGLARVGEHDWYGAGAAELVGAQLSDGSWAGTFEREGTLFALLFLRRASAPRVPRTGPEVARRRVADPDAAVRVGGAPGTPARLWIEGFRRPAAAALEWPGEEGLGPRVLRVEYLGDGEVVAVALGDPERPAGAARFAAEHLFLAPGTVDVAARVRALAPPREEGGEPEEVVLESDALALEIERVPPPGASGARPALELAAARPRTEASSEHAAPAWLGPRAFGAELALDGNPRTPWIAAVGDERPTLEIRLRRPLRAEGLRLRPARLAAPGLPAPLPARSVELRLNRGEWRAWPAEEEAGALHELALDAPTAIRSIELRFAPGAGPVGVGELELW